MVAQVSNVNVQKRLFLRSSGLDRFSLETKINPKKPDRIYIVYRKPVTNEVMRAPNDKPFCRYRLFKPKDDPKYLSAQKGGIHLYFPACRARGQVIDYLKAHPNAPVYITEGEKKAAKAWLEGIPCIGLSGIWCWLANKQDRPDGEKILHPDFDYIPDLASRVVIMIYDSDANSPDKKADFDKCSNAFERCLRSRGISRYEKIVLPSDGDTKVGLDDYLLEHPVNEFEKIVAEQSMFVPFTKYVMTSKEFLSAKFSRIRSILEPWLGDTGLTMVHSAPGVGKTFFLLGLSVAITRKKLPEEFCGWKIKRGAGVLFVDGEMPPAITQSRLAKVEAGFPNNPTSKKRRLWLLSGMNYSRQTGKVLSFSNEDSRNEFRKYVAKRPEKVIILDNIVSLMSVRDENDAGAWAEINQWLVSLRAMGKSVIIVHHSSKGGKQRGTSHRSDNLDTIINLVSRGDDGVLVKFEKHRNFGAGESAPVSIDFNIDNDMVIFTRSENSDVDIAKRNKYICKMHKRGRPYDYMIEKIRQKTGQTITKGRISQIIAEMKKMEQKAKV